MVNTPIGWGSEWSLRTKKIHLPLEDSKRLVSVGDITAHFSRHEFKCKGLHCCGGSDPINIELVRCLQSLRDMVGKPLIISSGFRCRKHNKDVGGAHNSQHIFGDGVDVKIPTGMNATTLKELAEKIPAFRMGGIGLYNTWVHLDIRKNGPARWDSRK